MRRSRVLAVAMIGVLILLLAGCAGKVDLFINAKAGDSYKYHYVSEVKSATEMMGQKITSTQKITTDYSLKVEKIDPDGIMTIQYTYETIAFEMDAMGQKVFYDSSKSGGDETLSKVYKNIIGKGFTVKMSKHGEIKEVTGLSKLIESVLEEAQDGEESLDDTALKQFKQSMEQAFGDDAVKSLLQQSMQIFPDGEVNVGDTWEREFKMKTIMDMTISAKYKLDKVDGDDAYLVTDAKIKVDDSKPLNMMGIEMRPSLKGNMTSKIKVNINNGFLNEGTINQNISGKMSIELPELGKMDVPMNVTTKTTYSVVKQ